MSNELPPPPPPPAPEGENSAQSGAPKLKLNKPISPVAAEGVPVPPPPVPSAGSPIPPPPAPTATAPVPTSAPRPAPSPANRNVGKFAATVDLLALAASLAAVALLAIELFSKSKG